MFVLDGQCVILYSRGEYRLTFRRFTTYRALQEENILCKWCSRLEEKVWCKHMHIYNVTLKCTRCETSIIPRTHMGCRRRTHLGREKVPYNSLLRKIVFPESNDDQSEEESGVADVE
ncbi:hypothetical protein TcasGA2_TC001496 [Tribolium castaneum]|uniref:Uncharacterized protein n=1 Tax=Tribolium castaneum TaxID=7070 RepID=A0A139W9C1_TRICA|nr:PREDICTED: uncharacterized protein LOC103313683 isoform X1 [Tribolium castaneum]KXZ75880.1 hypothetical protein TcasGA2_TC001496 [Tribolium castaneum]|eukprot:XP_008195806.1 PREDICTED: uncharacterized protein LOC103313683 isoform X1 [Tribolium castaneum]